MKNTGNKLMRKVKGLWVAVALIGAVGVASVSTPVTVNAQTTSEIVLTSNKSSNFETKEDMASSDLVKTESKKALESITGKWELNTLDQVTSEIERQQELGLDVYVVQWGDTLSVIAEAIDADVQELAELNGVDDRDFILTGDILDGVLKEANESKGNTQNPTNNKVESPATETPTTVKPDTNTPSESNDDENKEGDNEVETPNEGDTETPNEGDTETPNEDDTETPNEGDTETPNEDDTETPNEGDTETPNEDDTETPNEGDTETPNEDDTETPNEDDTETPNEDDVEEPNEDDTETPNEDDTETPNEDDVEEPNEDDTEDPDEDDVETPNEDDTETPNEDDTETPNEDDTETPNEDDTETPNEDDTETPNEDDTETPNEDDVETPNEDDVEEPNEDDTETPNEDDTEEPNEDDTETPNEDDTEEEDEIVVTEVDEIQYTDFVTETRENDELPEGERRVVQEGQKGTETITYEVTTINGEETSRVELRRELTTSPVNEIIEIGTQVDYQEPTKTVVEHKYGNVEVRNDVTNEVNIGSTGLSMEGGAYQTGRLEESEEVLESYTDDNGDFIEVVAIRQRGYFSYTPNYYDDNTLDQGVNVTSVEGREGYSEFGYTDVYKNGVFQQTISQYDNGVVADATVGTILRGTKEIVGTRTWTEFTPIYAGTITTKDPNKPASESYSKAGLNGHIEVNYQSTNGGPAVEVSRNVVDAVYHDVYFGTK